MPEVATPTPPSIFSVPVLHEIAEGAIAAYDGDAADYGIIQQLLAVALAARAETTAHVVYRFHLLRETLVREEASDFAVTLLEAIVFDLGCLIGAMGPRA